MLNNFIRILHLLKRAFVVLAIIAAFVGGTLMTNTAYAGVDPVAQLANAVNQLKNAVLQNAKNIEGEIGARILNDNNLQFQIDDLNNQVTFNEDEINARLTAEIEDVNNQITFNEDEINAALAAETDARIAADQDLQGQIDNIELIPGPEGPPGNFQVVSLADSDCTILSVAGLQAIDTGIFNQATSLLRGWCPPDNNGWTIFMIDTGVPLAEWNSPVVLLTVDQRSTLTVLDSENRDCYAHDFFTDGSTVFMQVNCDNPPLDGSE